MDKRRKQYVPVIVRFDAEGKMRPLVIEFDEEHKYPVIPWTRCWMCAGPPASGWAVSGTGIPARSSGK